MPLIAPRAEGDALTESELAELKLSAGELGVATFLPGLGKGRLMKLRILLADDHEIVRRGASAP